MQAITVRTALLLMALLLSFTACAPRLAVVPVAESNGELRIIRAGHATVWLDMGGFRVMTDPLFLGWLWMFPRHEPLGLDPADLPPVDAVVISHPHFDHFDPPSLRRIGGTIPILFPPDSDRYHPWVAPHKGVTMDWWQSVEIRNADGVIGRITALPAQHWGGRLGFDGLWNGTFGSWMLEANGYTVYFGGDTGMDEALFRAIAERFPKIDVALLPIGPIIDRSENNRMLRMHINPPEALRVAELLNAKLMIPIHYGAFRQGPTDPFAALRWLEDLMTEDPDRARMIAVLAPGEKLSMGSTGSIAHHRAP
jgi:N-acyl-phosphatidylethanolamine-hydrolysing phospholipase D